MSNEPIQLPVFETIKEAWDKVKGAKASLWAVLALVIIARLILAGFDELNKSDIEINFYLGIILDVIAIALAVVSLVLNWCLIYLGVLRALSMPIQFSMIKAIFSWRIFFRMIVMFILQVVVMLPAIIIMLIPAFLSSLVSNDTTVVENNMNSFIEIFTAFCYLVSIVISIYLLIRMWLSSAYVLIGGAKPWAAIKLSFKSTKGNVWRLIGLFVMNMLIILVSMIPFGLGLIWSIPYALINYGEVYKKLKVADEPKLSQ